MDKSKGCSDLKTLASDGGQRDIEVAKAVNKVEMRTRMAIPLSDDGKEWIHVSLNPCGEHLADANAQIPDGTLSQSAVLRGRIAQTLIPPFLSPSETSIDTRDWSLMMYAPPTIRGVALVVASPNAVLPDSATYRTIFDLINREGISEAPLWTTGPEVPGISPTAPYRNFYYTWIKYGAIDLQINPASGESGFIESYRIAGDGIVFEHNCPTLLNQGTVAVGQFKNDFVVNPAITQTILEVQAVIGVVPVGLTDANIQLTMTVGPLASPTTLVTGTFTLTPTSTGAITLTNAGQAPPPGTEYTIRTGVLNWVDNVTSPFDVIVGEITPSSTSDGWGFELSTSTTAAGAKIVVNIDRVFGNVNIPQDPRRNLTAFGTAIEVIETEPSLLVSPPPLDQESVVQADPLYTAEIFKRHNGVYLVRRYFEPVLNMANSNTYGAVKFVTPGMDRGIAASDGGGIQNDLMDRNASAMVVVLTGISYAAKPFIHANRYVEVMPAPNSQAALFTKPTPSKDSDSIEIFREMQIQGPHSYVPQANLLGTLNSFITDVVDGTAVFLRRSGGVALAVADALEDSNGQTHQKKA